MKILQTLATENWDNYNYRKQSQFLLHHCVSINSIRQAYGNDQEIILITDTRGKELVENLNFPYTSINTALDSYPYTRPFREVGYKIYGFELYPDDDIIHFDNDVFIKQQLPEFTEVLVQSYEGNNLEMVSTWDNREVPHAYNDWVFPPLAMSGNELILKHNYNPGVLGIKANCSIRNEYVSSYNTFLETNTNNLIELKEDYPALFNQITETQHQFINTALEESFLYHLCEDNNINVVQVLNQSDNITDVVLYDPDLDNGVEHLLSLKARHYDNWQELGYIHPFSIKRRNKPFISNLFGDFNTDPESTFIPTMREPITLFLEKRWGISDETTDAGISTAIKMICAE